MPCDDGATSLRALRDLQAAEAVKSGGADVNEIARWERKEGDTYDEE